MRRVGDVCGSETQICTCCASASDKLGWKNLYLDAYRKFRNTYRSLEWAEDALPLSESGGGVTDGNLAMSLKRSGELGLQYFWQMPDELRKSTALKLTRRSTGAINVSNNKVCKMNDGSA